MIGELALDQPDAALDQGFTISPIFENMAQVIQSVATVVDAD